MKRKTDNRAGNTQSQSTQPRPGLSDLLSDQDRYWPINNSIRENLGPVEHAALSGTSRQHAAMVEGAREVYHNINRHLARFVSDPIAFRCLQAKHNGLITAPFSTQYMSLAYAKLNGDIKTDYLFMMFEKNTGEQDMAQLLTKDRYEFRSRNTGLPAGAQLFERIESDDRVTKVVLIFLPAPPIYSLLKSIGMTGDANFITWNKAYALFANATFAVKENYLLQSLSDSGIFNDPDMDLNVKHLDKPWFDAPSITGPRSVGDTHTRKEHLDINGIWPSAMPDFAIESASFKLEPVRMTRWEKMQYYTIHTFLLNHPVLKYPHLHLGCHADRDTQRFINWIGHRLNHSTYVECSKIPPSEQTEEVHKVIIDPRTAQASRGKFTLPAEWNYWDATVIEKFNEFYDRQAKKRKP